MSAKHTPTPYRVNEDFQQIGDVTTLDGERAICIAQEVVGDRIKGSPVRRANAAFIVKACNSHDALVKALSNLVRLCSPLSRGPALEEAREALRDAGVKEV